MASVGSGQMNAVFLPAGSVCICLGWHIDWILKVTPQPVPRPKALSLGLPPAAGPLIRGPDACLRSSALCASSPQIYYVALPSGLALRPPSLTLGRVA